MTYPNVGGIDRILRVSLGPVLIVAGVLLLTGKSSLGMMLAVVGVLALVTGIVRFCVLYVPFGVSTVRPREKTVSLRKTCCGGSMKETPGELRATKR
jgi:DUF2892 family protein